MLLFVHNFYLPQTKNVHEGTQKFIKVHQKFALHLGALNLTKELKKIQYFLLPFFSLTSGVSWSSSLFEYLSLNVLSYSIIVHTSVIPLTLYTSLLSISLLNMILEPLKEGFLWPYIKKAAPTFSLLSLSRLCFLPHPFHSQSFH